MSKNNDKINENPPSESDTAICSLSDEVNSPSSDCEMWDKIGEIRSIDYIPEAKYAADKIPESELIDAFNWTATYLVELESRMNDL